MVGDSINDLRKAIRDEMIRSTTDDFSHELIKIVKLIENAE